MTWFDVIKNNEATNALLEIILKDLKDTIPHHIESLSFMSKHLNRPPDYRVIREAFNRTWSNPQQVISMDLGWVNQFMGDGYEMKDVSWKEVTIRVMKMYDQIIDNI
tara:strand:- start:323 stop:643 length:321 start_codon:yes stop_codon:yes gene_type:complete